jgi:hypothetical protein
VGGEGRGAHLRPVQPLLRLLDEGAGLAELALAAQPRQELGEGAVAAEGRAELVEVEVRLEGDGEAGCGEAAPSAALALLRRVGAPDHGWRGEASAVSDSPTWDPGIVGKPVVRWETIKFHVLLSGSYVAKYE